MQNDFFCPAVDAISPAHPLHLIVGFQCFGHAFLAHHGSLDDFQPVFAGGVGFRQIGKEFFCKQQGTVKDRTVLLQIIGIVLCSGIGNQLTIDLRGFGLALVSGFFYAAYILVLSYESRDPMPLYALMLNVSIAGVPLCAVVGWLTNSLTVSLTLQAWKFAAVAALLVSIMGCVLFQKGIRCIGDTDAAAFSLLESISSIFFGILLMNDVPKLGTMFGSMMIVAGLFFNAMRERKKVCQSQL